MPLITKNNLLSFIEYYHSFHASYITHVNYNINFSQIGLLNDIFWVGKLIQKKTELMKTRRQK